MSETRLYLPEPLPHQVPVLEHAARFKMWRKGRRTGGSRAGVLAAVAGHGPNRALRGMLQGGHIVWFGPDYKQTQAIWREEIRPRFAGLPWATVEESERRITIPGRGSLQILSAENIDAARGRKLDGAVLDESAHFDLEYAWTAVIRPALADKQGWGFFVSSPNSGHDGNQLKRVPSYFNVLCERVARGELGESWKEFHNRTEDNEKIPRDEIAQMYAEYGPDSPTAKQELGAELGVMGGRYYTINADVHRVPRSSLPETLPDHWEYWGAFDWGFGHWSVFGVFAKDTTGTTILLGSWWARRQQDAELAQGCWHLLKELKVPNRLSDIYAGHDCWSKVTAHAASGITTAEIFGQHGLWLAKADIDKANGGKALRRALAIEDSRSRLVIVDTPENRRVLNQLADIIPDPNDINKPLKVDADVDGRGGDDGADMVRYGIASRVPDATLPAPKYPDHWTPDRDDEAYRPQPAQPAAMYVGGYPIDSI